MVMNTMPMKYAVPAGSARIKLLIALAARYTGCTARGWDVLDGLHTHPAFQISGRFCYSLGKTRINSSTLDGKCYILGSKIRPGSQSLSVRQICLLFRHP